MSEKSTPPNSAASSPTGPDPQDPLNVPMDRVITKDTASEGRPTRKTADLEERLPEDPEAQNDLA